MKKNGIRSLTNTLLILLHFMNATIPSVMIVTLVFNPNHNRVTPMAALIVIGFLILGNSIATHKEMMRDIND